MKRESIIMWLLTGSIMFFGCTENQVPEDEVVKTPTDSVKPDQDTTVVFPKDTDIIVPFDRTDWGDEQSDSLVVNENDTIILGTGHGANTITLECGGVAGSPEIEGDYGPPSIITIVKFHNPEIKKKVIVQHPIKRYHDGYEYYDDTKLYLNLMLAPVDGANAAIPIFVAEWADKRMHIAGTSPYIPLADGYYMVDWKWDQLMPLSSLAEGHIDAYHDYFKEHILNHVFTTNYEWENFKNLTIGYDESMHTQHVKGIEIIRVWPLKLACMYDDIGPYWGDNFPYFGWIYYFDGMCLVDAYRYSENKSGNWNPKNRDYIAFCDSMQTVFQSRLIDIINKGQLKEIGF